MTSAKKRGRSMFDCSGDLFGEAAHVPKGNARKFSDIKTAEIGGSNPANQLSAQTLRDMDKKSNNSFKQA